MIAPRILPFGDRALLVEVDSLDDVLLLYPLLEAARRDGITELVPAARSVLVSVDPARLSLGAAERWVYEAVGDSAAGTGGRAADAAQPSETTPVTIPVHYDGADLGDVARVLGITADEVIRRHTAAAWRVAFIGFAPGFAYLASTPATFEVPRRSTSRPSVPAGSVGLAGEFTGIYPRPSPGGWQLIGRTDSTLWDVTRPNPALLVPGMLVQFAPVDDRDAPVTRETRS